MMRLFFKKTTSIFLSVLIIFSCFLTTASAATALEVLTFKSAGNGYATVTDCKTSAKGTVKIPSKVEIKNKTYTVKYIGENAFENCKSITKIIIPEGVTSIKSKAFLNCSALKELYVPETLVRCEYDAFDGCGSFTVHCFVANSNLIGLCGMHPGITLDIIDMKADSDVATDDAEESDPLASFGIIGTFVKALQNLIDNIMSYFGVNEEDEFEFDINDLPFDLPFDIEIEDDNPLFDFG